MKQLPRMLTLLSVLSLAACQYLTPSSFNKNDRTPGNRVDDSIIENSIEKELKAQGFSKANHVNVNVFNAVVLLSGEIETVESKQRINQIANSVYRVRKVYDVTTLSAPSSLVARSSDGIISSKIKTHLFRYPETRKSKVKVVTEDGVVYLMGLVTEKESQTIVRAVSTVGGVQKIVKLFEIIP